MQNRPPSPDGDDAHNAPPSREIPVFAHAAHARRRAPRWMLALVAVALACLLVTGIWRGRAAPPRTVAHIVASAGQILPPGRIFPVRPREPEPAPPAARPAVTPDPAWPEPAPAPPVPLPPIRVPYDDGEPAPRHDGAALKSGPAMMVATASRLGQTEREQIADGSVSADAVNLIGKNASHASRSGDRDYRLLPGTFIECILQTRIVTNVPGLTTCIVSRDVYSASGKRVLVPRGTTVVGEYRADLAQGSQRIYVAWNRLFMPSGFTIDLASPAVDGTGAAGLPGVVDDKFAQRFGGALLLSILGDATSYLLARSTDARHGVNVNLTAAGTMNSLAASALNNTINIPPTLYKNHGDQIGILVARPLDFSILRGTNE
ncbi:putative bacterial secretion system protein [Bordetella bronchiseptica MO211]|uniref:type IV secretion system protein VirB10 n=1 Tax=Bordetella bronchiseptica TaxID=518 RepID=UPI00029023D9|nr:putative bacterial secretion system protein [Bordetella bronchiseptica MO211]